MQRIEQAFVAALPLDGLSFLFQANDTKRSKTQVHLHKRVKVRILVESRKRIRQTRRPVFREKFMKKSNFCFPRSLITFVTSHEFGPLFTDIEN